MNPPSHPLSTARSAISVVLVTYNSAPDVAQTAASVAAQLQVGDELIVIDNGSSDDTIDLVLQSAPGTHVVRQSNVGFASGCNAGAQIAHGDLLMFLNPDALLEPGALELLRAHAQQEPSWDAWQPLITLADQSLVNTAG
ncbi:MAG: glycosyltransferase, partial [Thermoleophilaceae bacterium]|nr:glycosyltransferase [Thermoleophilaceae bacterium]